MGEKRERRQIYSWDGKQREGKREPAKPQPTWPLCMKQGTRGSLTLL